MEATELIVTSPVFDNEAEIPVKYTCDGDEINPPLHIEKLPEGTQTLAVIMEDPDAPGRIFDHWLVWSIDAVNDIPENSVPGIEGMNGAGKIGYHGPKPPSGTHRYMFFVFALDADLNLPTGATKTDLQDAMNGHILAQGSVIGLYTSKNK